MTCGNFCFDDNIAWLSGNLVSGYLGYGDAIDFVKNVISADWVSAGFDIFAVVPFVGDSSKTVDKLKKFVERVPRKFTEVTRLVATAQRLPDSVKKKALKVLMFGRYGRLTNMGLTDDVVLRLARGRRTDLRLLADAAGSPMRRQGAGIRWSSRGDIGEARVRKELGLAEAEGVWISRTPPKQSRTHDGTEVLSPGKRRNHETKTGRPDRDEDLEQCEKDAQIAKSSANQVVEVVWHFVGNSQHNSIGPSRELLKCLERWKVPFIIHPATS